MARISRANIALFLCALLTGLVITSLFTVYKKPEPSSTTETMQYSLSEIERMQTENADLLKQLEGLERTGLSYEQSASVGDQDLQSLARQKQEVAVYAGHTDLTGPGVQVVLNDAADEDFKPGTPVAFSIVHDNDVLRVVNELRTAGAEAIAINGVRVTASTRIRCGGPTIHIRDTALAPPFTIHAIGDPKRLEQTLLQGDGSEMSLYQELTMYGLTFQITKQDHVLVPRVLESKPYLYAKDTSAGG